MKKSVLGLMATAMVIAFAGCQFNDFGKSSRTSKKIAENLYYMEFTGDDALDTFLENGGANNAGELAEFLNALLSKGPFKSNATIDTGDFGCAAFIAENKNGGYVMGRNYDWDNCTTLILKDTPTTGYASISTVNLDFLGFGEGFAPNNMVNKLKALAGLYVPMDGVNEKGLVVADLMAGDGEVTNQNTDKKDLTTTTAIRMLLNKAASVDEAITLLEQYDMHSDIGTGHHLFIADSTGNSVVVEWSGNEMYNTGTEVLTNHYIGTPKAGTGSENSKLRFGIIKKSLEENAASFDTETAKDTLNSVNAYKYGGKTQWSIVYDLTKDKPSINFYWHGAYEKCYNYSL